MKHEKRTLRCEGLNPSTRHGMDRLLSSICRGKKKKMQDWGKFCTLRLIFSHLLKKFTRKMLLNLYPDIISYIHVDIKIAFESGGHVILDK